LFEWRSKALTLEPFSHSAQAKKIDSPATLVLLAVV